MASITPVDLDLFPFSRWADIVLAQGTLATAASELASGAIINDGPTNTRGRRDEIVAIVEGSDTPASSGFLVGILNTSTLETRGGGDLIEADMSYSGTAATMTVIGILGDGDHVFDTGGGGDDIIANVNASSTGTITGIAIDGASIQARNGNDFISGVTTISDAAGNSGAYGILDSVIDTSGSNSNDNDEIRAFATISGQSLVRAQGLGGSTVSTGNGNDEILGSASATIGGGAAGTAIATGISLAYGGSIATGDGDDLVSGFAYAADFSPGPTSSGFFSAIATGIGGKALFGNFERGTITTGTGNDTIIGVSETVSPNLQVSAGIDGVVIDTGTGGDTVTGRVQNVTGLQVLASTQSRVGIDESLVTTGSGNDAVIAEINAALIAEGTAAWSNYGIRESAISTDAGADLVEAKAAYSTSGSANFGFSGIVDSTISTGTEDDVVTVTSEGTLSGVGGRSGAFGIHNSTVSVGDGNDSVTVSLSVQAGDGSTIEVRGIVEYSFQTTVVDLGDGDNSLDVRLSVDAGASTEINNTSVNAIDGGTVIGGSGIDTIDVHIVANAGAGTELFAFDAIRFADITLGGGGDVLRASTVLDGTGLAGASGHGISATTVDMGAGNDQIIATGASQTIPGSLNVTSFGIANSTVSLGDGDDSVTASGAEGGVSGSLFFGGDGNDSFDFGSGVSSTINGGAGSDTLALGGVLSDYLVSSVSATEASIVDVASNGATTSLTVTEIEVLSVGGVSYDFETLLL